MAKIFDIRTGELIKPEVSDEDKVSQTVMIGVAVSEAVFRLGDPNSGLTHLELEELIKEHAALFGGLSRADQDVALTQTNQILNDNQKVKEN